MEAVDIRQGAAQLGAKALFAEAEVLSRELREQTDRRIAARAEPANDEIIAAVFGLRATNALRALSRLDGQEVDDQVAVIGRSLTEAVLDLLYVRTPTVRKVEGRSIFLRTLEKEELFLTSGVISEKRVRGAVLTVPQEELDRAKALRERLGLQQEPVYWHGARGAGSILEELLAAESDVTRNSTLRTTYEMFKLFSLGTHSSPLLFSVEEAPGGGWPWKLRRGYVSEGTVEACTVLALHVLKIWGDAVGLDVTNRAGALIARLNSGSKTQPPDSSSGEHRREPIDEWREPSGRVPEGEV